MRFVIYRNSVLASFLSMFGAAMITLAIVSLINGELGVLESIGAIAGGAGLMWLASVISKHKAKKKQAKAAAAGGRNAGAAAAGSSANAGRAGVYQPSGAGYASAPVNQAGVGKSLSKPMVIAAIFFMLVLVLGILTNWQYNANGYPKVTYGHNYTDIWHTVEYGACILMMIACFLSRRKREVSALHVLGVLGLIASRATGALNKLNVLRNGIFHGLLRDIEMPPVYEAVAFLLMLIFALASMPKAKRSIGGITKALWWLPTLLMLLGCVIFYNMVEVGSRIGSMLDGKAAPHIPFIVDLIYQLALVLAVALTGFAFQRSCRNPVAAGEATKSYVQPEPVSGDVEYCPHCGQANQKGSAFCSGCGQRSSVAPPPPRPESQAQPEPPRPQKTVSEAERQEMEKKMQAYKDLLDCGILTQQEYDQKINELKRA